MAKRKICGRCKKPPAQGVGWIESCGIRICLPCVKSGAAEADASFEPPQEDFNEPIPCDEFTED